MEPLTFKAKIHYIASPGVKPEYAMVDIQIYVAGDEKPKGMLWLSPREATWFIAILSVVNNVTHMKFVDFVWEDRDTKEKIERLYLEGLAHGETLATKK